MFYTYVLSSLDSERYYIGQTNNLRLRLERHNKGHSIYTKNKGPWKILFSRSFYTRKEAVAFETKLKSFKNRVYLQRWIEENQELNK